MTLRYLKYCVHHEFDKLWEEGLMSRNASYVYLQYLMGIVNPQQAHISSLSYVELAQLLRRLRRAINLKTFFELCNKYKFKLEKKIKQGKKKKQKMYYRWSSYLPLRKYDIRLECECMLCGFIGSKEDVKKNAGCLTCRLKKANKKLQSLIYHKPLVRVI